MERFAVDECAAIFAVPGGFGFFGHGPSPNRHIDGKRIAVDAPLSFTVPIGQTSAAQTINVSTLPNNGNTVTVQIPQASSWIQVSPGVITNTPGNLSVTVNAANLTTGTHTGSFTAMILGNANSVVTVNVSANVTSSSVLSATPTSLNFAAQSNANFGTPQGCALQNSPTTCQVTILTSGPQLHYNIIPSTTDKEFVARTRCIQRDHQRIAL